MLTYLLAFVLGATVPAASVSDSVLVAVPRFQIGPVVQAGTIFQRMAHGSDFDPAYFSYNKTNTGYGIGLRLKANLWQHTSIKAGYTYARRAHSFNQHNFNIQDTPASVGLMLFSMGHELGAGFTRSFTAKGLRNFSIGAGYSYNIHSYTMERSSNLLGVGGPNAQPGGRGYFFGMQHGGLGKSYTSHTASVEINYMPLLRRKRPLEFSLSFHHDLTPAPKMAVESGSLGPDQEVVQRFSGVMVPANSTLRLSVAWYMVGLSRL